MTARSSAGGNSLPRPTSGLVAVRVAGGRCALFEDTEVSQSGPSASSIRRWTSPDGDLVATVGCVDDGRQSLTDAMVDTAIGEAMDRLVAAGVSKEEIRAGVTYTSRLAQTPRSTEIGVNGKKEASIGVVIDDRSITSFRFKGSLYSVECSARTANVMDVTIRA